MTLQNYFYNNLPKYYPSMYLDGYTPEQILATAHKDMIEEYTAEPEGYEVHITSEVKLK